MEETKRLDTLIATLPQRHSLNNHSQTITQPHQLKHILIALSLSTPFTKLYYILSKDV